ncbi:MAG: MFS transporter [Deltaproteobacteria bacterium]|nr:MFS transporter [Deltaproteobacteria bacterium]
MMDQKENSNNKFFYGWVITGVVFLNLAMAYGAQYSFGVFFPSLINEFGWNRQSISGAFSLYTFMYGILAVILGPWADRFGPRIVLIFGSACLGIGIGLISQVEAVWHIYVFYGLLASWGMSAAYITAGPTIVKWFVAKRGVALGLAQSGQGVGIILIPQLTGALISALGWRLACMVLGAAVFIVLLTMSLFLVGQPEKMGLKADGQKPSSLPKPERNIQLNFSPEISWSTPEAIRTRAFWVLTSVFFLHWIFVFLPLVHLVIFSLDIGLPKESALWALSILGGVSALGRLAMGFISDRIGRKQALMVCLGLQVFSWLWLVGATTSAMLYVFAAVFGFSYGGISTLFSAIVGDYFGRLQAASVIGTMFTMASPSAAVGPLLGGYIFDLTQGYQLAFLLGALTNLLSLILLFVAKPPGRNP